jgi:transmembrane sensor
MELRREALSATQRPRALRYAAAAAVIGVTVAIAYLVLPALRVERSDVSVVSATGKGGAFRTAVGERSNVTLSDGSSVILNTNSRIDVRFTAERRIVRLLAGQAWFQVARDANRPFVVEAADQRVTALGTAFDIRLGEQDSVQVTLAEGRVSVEPIRSSLARLIHAAAVTAELSPGEALIVSGDAPARKRKADLSKVNGWRQGQVVFDNDTLEAALAEVNRYSSTRIELADPSLATLRVSGVFKAGHSESFVETVTGHYPIRVATRERARIVLAPLDP